MLVDIKDLSLITKGLWLHVISFYIDKAVNSSRLIDEVYYNHF